MSRAFVNASSQFLRVTSAPFSTLPVTLACRLYVASLPAPGAYRYTCSIGEVANIDYHAIGVQNDGKVTARSWDGSASRAESLTSVSLNTWHSVIGVFNTDTDRRIYLDGIRGTDDTTSIVVGAFGAMAIGVSADSTPYGYWDGRVAEVAFWNIALTDAEAAILAAHYSPLLVHPQNLAAYYPLIRDEDQDRIGGRDMTPTNSPTITPHPPVLYPAPTGL